MDAVDINKLWAQIEDLIEVEIGKDFKISYIDSRVHDVFEPVGGLDEDLSMKIALSIHDAAGAVDYIKKSEEEIAKIELLISKKRREIERSKSVIRDAFSDAQLNKR